MSQGRPHTIALGAGVSSRELLFSLISSIGIDPSGRRNSMTVRMQNPRKIRPKPTPGTGTARNRAISCDL